MAIWEQATSHDATLSKATESIITGRSWDKDL